MTRQPQRVERALQPSEAEIRDAFVSTFASRATGGATWLSELEIAGGTVRADLVRVASKLEAFEIKSSADSLARLANQAWYYSKAFDEVNLIADQRHISSAVEILPIWWGIWEVVPGSPMRIIMRREASCNPWQDSSCLASLLTRPELVDIIVQFAGDMKIASIPRRELWSLAEQLIPQLELHSSVLAALSVRKGSVPHDSDVRVRASL